MSLDMQKDVKILKYCAETAHNRYQIAKHIANHYSSTYKRVNKLVSMQLLLISRQEDGRSGLKVKFFLTSDKGRAILRGYMEARRD